MRQTGIEQKPWDKNKPQATKYHKTEREQRCWKQLFEKNVTGDSKLLNHQNHETLDSRLEPYLHDEHGFIVAQTPY